MHETIINFFTGEPNWPACAVMLALGVLLLMAGGNWLVHGSVTIARRLGMPVLLVGLTIVAAGTSSPELAFNVIAAWSGNGEMCFGNVIGSNIANVGLVLGLCAVYGTLHIHSVVVRRELPWLVGITAIMFGLALLPTSNLLAGEPMLGYGKVDGLVYIVFFVFILRFWYAQAKKDARDPLVREVTESAEAEMLPSLPRAWIAFFLGLGALLSGGQVMKLGAIDAARLLNFTEALIGLTVVALATSLPEVFTSLIAVRKGHTDLAVGNVVGSNLFNILLVLGVTSLVAPVPLPNIWGWYDLSAMLLLTIALFPIALTNQLRVTRSEGALLLLAYLLYMTFSVFREYRADLIERWFNF